MSNTETPEPATERATRSTTARNPRRRARQSDNDTLQKAAPRRKRSKITNETYAPRDSTEGRPPEIVSDTKIDEIDGAGETNSVVNGSIDGHTYEGVGSAKVNGNGHHRHGRTGSATPVLDVEMPVRGKKGTVKRLHRSDGTTVLCSNECYSVKLLPSTPKELKKEGLDYRGSILGNHALAITQEKALVWDYTAHVAASNVRTFNMPFSTRGESLPFGALVPSNGISHLDLGLVLVSADTGKVVFYESLDRATSLGMFQAKRASVDGTIPLSGTEVVADIVPAAYATFVVTLSSGRIVSLTLKDMTGMPKVQSQFLKIEEVSSGGVFGSFSGFLKSNYRKDLAAVRTKDMARGVVQVVGLTAKAEVLLWELEWSGRSLYISSHELKEAIVKELKDATSPEFAGQADHAVALDFAIADKESAGNSQTLVSAGSEQSLDLFILLRIGSSDMTQYAVVEVSLPGDGSHNIERVHQLRSYSSDRPLSQHQKARLVVPKPGHSFYAVFEDAAVVAATVDLVDDSPEAQLHASYLQQDPFEDAIRLGSGKDLAFLGVCEESPRGTHASAIAFVRGAGLLRISAAEITSILRADTAFANVISPTPASMEVALATKAKALKALVTFVTKTYPALPRSTMWQLLWDAEKLAAAQQLWLAFEEHVALTIKGEKRKATVMDELAAWFERDFDFYQRPELANEIAVRRFFACGLHCMERLLTNLRLLLQNFYDQEECPPQEGLKRVIQADDIWLRALETVFNFRSENCADYGILPELIDDGILIDKAEYVDLPEFWTSSVKLVDNTLKVADLSRDLTQKCYEPEELDADGHAMVNDIADNNARLVQIYCLQAQESINWYSSRLEKRQQELADKMRQEYDQERYTQFRKLASVGRAESGMLLAEKYRDMDTLADMIIAEDQYLHEYSQEHDADKTQIAQFSADLHSKIQRYFRKYQKAWSDAFFNKLFASSSLGAKLLRAQKEWKEPLAEYLRGHPGRAKLCWINDITAESDYAHASQALAECAQAQETKLWSKKVELSLSKLALLAAEEAGTVPSSESKTNGAFKMQRSPQDELAILQVQERVFKHFTPEIQLSVDEDAELVNCMDKYGRQLDRNSALWGVLEHGIATILRHGILEVEELIDTLTLMSVVIDSASDDNLQGSETLQALIALEAAASSLPPSRFETLLALIWKRAYIYDDWNSPDLQINKKQSDEERKGAIQFSTLWQTFHHVLEAEITTKPDAQVRILMPSKCVGAACQPEDLSYRFPEPDILDLIINELRIQDEILSKFVTDRGLDAIAAQAERDNMNGHVNGLNGYLHHEDEGEEEEKEIAEEIDDGDVEME
ncbi:hypothetical protein CERZMDRAFT_113515 [Cercospora zeae-maydis SCOH1-5]|uniref:Nucleoporin Nup133/Nup155-like C-terminal domain-containing protein n=1 Tax=Cercospora zeae-maydis SCOH1-5 TaxID=717836 RepID=A0A6A6F9I9_9PEZI|nr:hypothetical protein CERZMDRAFT_113515 [Cercospora zeae-maydis SCOH1-5]